MTVARLIEAASLTDTGTLREVNEDRAEIFRDHGVCMVVDGMGQTAGALAAKLGVYAIDESLYAQRAALAGAARGPWETHPLAQAFQAAHARLLQLHREKRLENAACAVATAAVAVEGGLLVVHAGDARAYVLRGGRLRQATRDHQTHLHMLDAPDPPLGFRALGQNRDFGDGPLELDTFVVPLEPGDLWVLCTDGLFGQVREPDIAAILAAHPDLNDACRALVAAASAAGGHDNVGVVLARWG